MLTKRAISAVHVVFVVLVVAGALIHRVWLGSTYQAMCDNDAAPIIYAIYQKSAVLASSCYCLVTICARCN